MNGDPIPASRDMAAPKPAKRIEPPPFPGRILVVDDDAGVRDVVARVLRGAGHLVGCAEDGEAAWEALCADRFDALITDQEMPRLTGLELLRRVRSSPRNVPVILISGKMPWDEPDLAQLLPPGIAMEKPFSFSDLLTNVRRILMPDLAFDPSVFGGGRPRRARSHPRPFATAARSLSGR